MSCAKTQQPDFFAPKNSYRDRTLTGERGLALVSGIAGAGKSRLLRDVAAAYTDAGYRVIGTAVSGDAARTLREEAGIETRTVAKLAYELTEGRLSLQARDIIILDEASTIGSRDAALLLTEAASVGARVLMLGDVAQHGSVARGRVFADLIEAHGGVDMERSRRATAQWMRDVAGDLRAGRTAAALGQLRKHGAVAEYRSHEQAKAALITAWQQARSEGQSALLIAGRRSSVHDLNLLARQALDSELGRARSYVTSYGERSFAIGDRLVAREPDRLSQTVNGDLLRVVSHRKDGLLECQRVRDEKTVLWDTHEHPSLDYGYATTSYRAQGQTVDRVLVLAEQADDRRGVYVGVTRAREQVAIAYGKDEISDFGVFLDVSMRDRMQQSVAAHLELTRDSRRTPSLEKAHERSSGLGL